MNDIKYLAAVVILYNPTLDIIQNVNSYLDKIDHLYIIDNSEKTLEEIEESFSSISKIEYINNKKNLGVAEALNIAVEKAVKTGYKFLLTMDQDSYFEEDSLKKLLSLEIDEKVGIYSPFHQNRFCTNPPREKGFEEVSDVMTSGNIINLSAVSIIGYFKKDYFIDYVDVEYCMRLRMNGYRIVRNNDSILIHNEANLTQKKVFWKTIYPPNHSAIRWYYKIRNYLYLKKEYIDYYPGYFIVENRNIRNNILKVLFCEQDKLTKLRMMLKGLFNYYRNIKGKLTV